MGYVVREMTWKGSSVNPVFHETFGLTRIFLELRIYFIDTFQFFYEIFGLTA